MNDVEDKPIVLVDLPQPPEASCFDLQKVEKITMPHPYCITAGHVVEAEDHWDGMLGPEAIRAAEKRGVYCHICNKLGNILKFDEPETSLTLFIRVPNNRQNLNDISGLHAYLFENKAAFEAVGIQGFAFLNK
jgi:hypothetical protein